MLYLSTRNKTDFFTAYRAMHNDNTPDGGLYVPFRLVSFTDSELAELKAMTFGDAVAKILNLFFSQQLTGWDVDFCIGRTPAKVETVGHKVVAAELWHNPEGNYENTRNILYSRLYSTSEEPSDWAKTAIDIAVLFGLYTLIPNEDAFHIALCENEISIMTAAIYAANMGLPIGRLLLSCNELSPVWDLIRNGQVNTASMKRRDVNCNNFVERLIFDIYGYQEAQRYITAYTRNENYGIGEDLRVNLTDRIHAVVIGPDRAEKVIQSVARSIGYAMSADAAGAFGGLQDYRSQGGESRFTILLSGVKPAN